MSLVISTLGILTPRSGLMDAYATTSRPGLMFVAFDQIWASWFLCCPWIIALIFRVPFKPNTEALCVS